jgi:hypothetical protein
MWIRQQKIGTFIFYFVYFHIHLLFWQCDHEIFAKNWEVHRKKIKQKLLCFYLNYFFKRHWVFVLFNPSALASNSWLIRTPVPELSTVHEGWNPLLLFILREPSPDCWERQGRWKAETCCGSRGSWELRSFQKDCGPVGLREKRN